MRDFGEFEGENVKADKIDDMSQEDRAVMQSILRRIREAQSNLDQPSISDSVASIVEQPSPKIVGDKA